MSLINWKPRNSWMDFPRWVDTFFDDENLRTERDGFVMPAVNVAEDDKHFTLEVAVPGMEKKDIQIRVDKGTLILEAEARMMDEKKEDNYTRREFSYNAFKRTFWLPENVNADAISAEYTNGLLTLSLPKKVVDKPTTNRKILIE